MATDDAIQTLQLTKSFPVPGGGELTAVETLDLAVHEGEIFGLLGPNGAGKTTTVGMLTTRVIPSSGKAMVGGIDVVADPVATKLSIGVVPQVSTLDRSLTVGENLYFHGRYFGMGAKTARRKTGELLEQFQLSDKEHNDTLTLSGGMAQRLMIARAILHEPAVLFLDEPTAGLDPQSRIALWEMVRELHRGGTTILLTTHYMEEADQLCERVAVMDHGRILALDTPEALKQSVGADTEVHLTSDGDPAALATCLETLDGVTRTQIVDGTVFAYLRGESGSIARVISHADSSGFAVHDVSITEPTLETVFITLTGKDLRD
jgi:ABC-2 type transport system ATP-binding protein